MYDLDFHMYSADSAACGSFEIHNLEFVEIGIKIISVL